MIILLRKSIFLIICVSLIAGCSGNGSSSSGGGLEPLPEQELAGVWIGSFVNTTGVDPYLNNAFTVGVITQDGTARFIGNDTQFIADGEQTSLILNEQWGFFGQYVQGELDACAWDTTGPDYYCTSNLVEDIAGYVVTRLSFWGLYNRDDFPGIFSLYYNTTYEVSPNVHNLEGNWFASNVFEQGNTLRLTFTPDVDNTTSGLINGDDDLGNTFSGEIEIHYSADSEDTENVYDVTLTFNGEDLTGLATYVEQMSTEGIVIPKRTLALGVTNNDLTRMISVLSTLGD